jgi:hypothetical protein
LSKKTVPFDRSVIDAAILRADLSHVRVARELGVPLRTWMRWMEKEAIPAGYVTDAVLLLDLPEPKNMPADLPRTPWIILRGIEGIQARLDRIERLTEQDVDGPRHD